MPFKEGSWIIVSKKYYPILVIEIKSPYTTITQPIKGKRIEEKLKLVEPKILGQIYNYMKTQHSFRGQKHVYAIVTTLDEWKFCCLPDTQKSAESGELWEEFFASDKKWDKDNYEFGGEILTSRIYRHYEPGLVKLILSVIVKSYYSSVFPVSLFSLERNYIHLESKLCMWKKYTRKELSDMENGISFDIPHGSTTKFTVLKYFYGGHYSNVRLCMSKNGNIVVIKSFINNRSEEEIIQTIEKEIKCWQDVNGIKIYSKIITNEHSLIMPLVFNIKLNRAANELTINTDLYYWLFDEHATPTELPPYLMDINQKLGEIPLNIENIITQAIEQCAKKGYVHDDLKYRHIAVYPEFERNSISFRPVLIGFELSHKIKHPETVHSAIEQMNETLGI